MPFVAVSAFKIQPAKIPHGFYAVSSFLALKNACTHDIYKKNSRHFEPPEVLSASSIPGARSRGKQDIRAKGGGAQNWAELAHF